MFFLQHAKAENLAPLQCFKSVADFADLSKTDKYLPSVNVKALAPWEGSR